MASASNEEIVVLELTDPCRLGEPFKKAEEISISTADIENWNLDLILSSRIVKVHANRSRLIRESTYFRGLLDGSFSESRLNQASIQWNIETVINVIQHIYNSPLIVTPINFLLLLEAALFFGVDSLFSKCELWLRHVTSVKGLRLMPLELVLDTWRFGSDHGIVFVQDICEAYLSQNFAWVASASSFADIPYDLLLSCVEHPQLTVECEKQLCKALLLWLIKNTSLEGSFANTRKNYFDILKKVRICLLPLDYVAGLRKQISQFVDERDCAIFDFMNDYFSILVQALKDGFTDNCRIRLTDYSEKVVLSGCMHLTASFLFRSSLPHNMDDMLKARIIRAFTMLDNSRGDSLEVLTMPLKLMAFEHVCEVDVSECYNLQFVPTIMWLHLTFPSLRIFKAPYCLCFTIDDLLYLIKKCPHICEVDLTVDSSPVQPTTSVLSAVSEEHQHTDRKQYKKLMEMTSLSNSVKSSFGRTALANISKLTLEGRNDINDSDLLYISTLFDSLSFLNIRGCTLVTDMGISKLICKCRKIHSLILSYTAFGKLSILTLCSSHTYLDGFIDHKYSDMMAFRLQELQIDGCTGIQLFVPAILS